MLALFHISCMSHSFQERYTSSSLDRSWVSGIKCFHNCTYLVLFFIPPHPPPLVHMSLSFQLCIATLQCSLLFSSGKIILPSPNPASLISDRGEMNKGSKEPFSPFYSHCRVIFTLGLCGSAQCHRHTLHMAGFSILWDLGWCTCVIIETKPFRPNIFKGKTRADPLLMVNIHQLKPKNSCVCKWSRGSSLGFTISGSLHRHRRCFPHHVPQSIFLQHTRAKMFKHDMI